MLGISKKIYNFVLYIKNKLMRKKQPKQDPSYMLFIFGDFDDLKEYVDMAMSEITEQYFLMEVTKNVDVKMPRKLKKDFLNIDGEEKKRETRTGEINVESKLKERKEELKNFTFEFLMPMDFDKMVQKNEPDYLPTVDEILDKISEKGIDSLTEKEKEILDNYGKRKDGGR